MFKDTYQIISIPDNNKYSRQTMAALDNKGKPKEKIILLAKIKYGNRDLLTKTKYSIKDQICSSKILKFRSF